MSILTASSGGAMRNAEYDNTYGLKRRDSEELDAIRIGLGRAIQNEFFRNELLITGVIDDDQIVTKTTDRYSVKHKVRTLEAVGPWWVWRKRKVREHYVVNTPLNYFNLSALGKCYEFWVYPGKRRKVTHSDLPECEKMKFLVFLGYLPFLFALAGLWLAVAADNHSLALLTVPFLTYVYAAMRRNYIVGYAKAVRLHNLWALLDRLSFKSEVRPFKNMQVNLLSVVADVLLIPLLCWGGLRATVAHVYYFDSQPGASYMRFLADFIQ